MKPTGLPLSAMFPLFLVLAVCPHAAGSQEEVHRVEHGTTPPACVADRSSARCDIESLLAIRPVEEDELGLLGQAVNWLVDLVFNRHGGNPPPYEFGGPVVDAKFVEYHILSWQGPAPDEPASGRHEVKAVIAQRHVDANGFAWPPEGWERSEISIENATSYLGGKTIMTVGASLARTVGVGSADSRCIGRLETPLCAVETWLACHARADPDLCRIASDGAVADTGAVPFFVPGHGFRYAVLRMVPVATDGGGATASNDIYEVVIENNLSPVDSQHTEFVRFVVVKRDAGWRVRDRDIILWERRR